MLIFASARVVVDPDLIGISVSKSRRLVNKGFFFFFVQLECGGDATLILLTPLFFISFTVICLSARARLNCDGTRAFQTTFFFSVLSVLVLYYCKRHSASACAHRNGIHLFVLAFALVTDVVHWFSLRVMISAW